MATIKLSHPVVRLQNKNFLISMLWPLTFHNPRKSTSIDAIESFTNGLVYKNKLKWESRCTYFLANNKSSTNNSFNDFVTIQWANLIRQNFLNELDCIKSLNLDLNIKNLSQAQLDNILMMVLENKNENDLFFLINQFLKMERLPSENITILMLKFLSVEGKVDKINEIEKVLKELKNPLLQKYSNLIQFKGLAYWKINNLDESLKILKSIFQKNFTHEGKILLHEIFTLIADDTFNNKGEAALVQLTHTAKEIYEKYNDIYLLACIWKCSFCSKFYSDQNIAIELIEQYDVLQKVVADKSVPLCSLLLRQHDVEGVYRLIELYLKYKLQAACKNCLHMLFDYQYFRRDLKACVEISKTCSEFEMPLNQTQKENFLKLLLNQPLPPRSRKKLEQNKFEYKF